MNSTLAIQHAYALAGTFNTRDFGGYVMDSGRIIKPHRLFRSDDLFNLTDADVKKLAALPLTTVIDYRNAQERLKRPNRIVPGADYIVLSPDDETAALASADLQSDQKKIDHLIEMEHTGTLDLSGNGLRDSMLKFVDDPATQRLYQEVLTLHLAKPGAVVLQHCRGGKDRTGYGSALVLLALGASEQTVIDDYLLTAQFNQERNRKRMAEYQQYTNNQAVLSYLSQAMATKQDVIVAALDEMRKISGSPLAYIRDVLKFDQAQIEQLRDEYLE